MISYCFRLHAWGIDLQEAFEQCAMAMFAYMTEINCVDLHEAHQIEAQGEDLESLLFHFLDEFLFLFSCEPFLIARVRSALYLPKHNLPCSSNPIFCVLFSRK